MQYIECHIMNAMLCMQYYDCNRFWMQFYECNVILLWTQYNVLNAMLDIMIMLLIAIAAGCNLAILFINFGLI